jgi:N-hydroxyarylamine O-acetyltransferase
MRGAASSPASEQAHMVRELGRRLRGRAVKSFHDSPNQRCPRGRARVSCAPARTDGVKPVDFDAYFERIGYAGRFAPTLEALQQLHALHAAAIPFENLAAFLGDPVRLDLDSIQEKLLRQGRGGWCFEHNVLFWHVLRGMGFDVATLAARVRWNVPGHVVTPRSHCLLRVRLPGGDYIADVGFGGLSLTAPLRLVPEVEQETPHERFRLRPAREKYTLEARLAGEWQALYVFDLHEQLLPDYEVSNWYLANHPQSQFVTGIVAARAAPDRRHALRNTRYAMHFPDGRTERCVLETVAELREVLAEAIGIRLPESPRLDARLATLIEANAPP